MLVDNASVRVLKISYAPGAKSAMHSHPDAILVPLATSKARFTMPDGKTQDMDVTKETTAWTPPTTHAPANVGTTDIDAILVELKRAPGTSTLPAASPGLQTATLVENPRAVANKTTAAPDFHDSSLNKDARQAVPWSVPLSRYFQVSPLGMNGLGPTPLTLIPTGSEGVVAPRLSVATAVRLILRHGRV